MEVAETDRADTEAKKDSAPVPVLAAAAPVPVPVPVPVPASLAETKAETETKADDPAPAPHDDDPHARPPLQKAIAILSLALPMALFALDSTMTATALPTIAAELGGGQLISWVGSSYMLASTALAPLWGKLGDIFGRKNTLLINLAVFVLASLLCALAPSMIVLIVGRGFQGLGGGGIQSLVFVLIADVVTLRERGSYQAILAAIVGGCAIIGPFLGGVITQHWSWRGTFWINLPAGALAGVGIFFFLRVPPPPDRSFKAMLKRVDWGGLVLCIASVVLFLLGLTWAAPYGWVSGQCLGPLIGGVVLGGVFVLYEAKVPAEPNVPLRLFKNRNYSLVVTAMFMLGYGMTGGSFWVPQFFQDAQGADATTAGVRSLAYMGPFIPVSLTCGILSSRFGVYIPFPKVGLAIAAVASGLLSLWNASTPYIPSELGYLLMLGAGFGMSNSMLMLANQVNCDVKDIGPGTTVGTFMRTIGGTMGIGVGGAVLGASIASTFSPTYIAELAGQWGVSTEVAGALVRSLLAGTPPPSGVDPGVVTAADMAVKEAYGSAYSKVFLSFAPVVAVGWLAALAITHVPLRGSGGPKKEESKDKDTKEEAANGNGESKEGNESVFVIEDV